MVAAKSNSNWVKTESQPSYQPHQIKARGHVSIFLNFVTFQVFHFPESQIQQNGNSGNGGAQSPVVVNALPEGLNIEELLEDIKKLKATVRKQGRRIAKLEQAKEESG